MAAARCAPPRAIRRADRTIPRASPTTRARRTQTPTTPTPSHRSRPREAIQWRRARGYSPRARTYRGRPREARIAPARASPRRRRRRIVPTNRADDDDVAVAAAKDANAASPATATRARSAHRDAVRRAATITESVAWHSVGSRRNASTATASSRREGRLRARRRRRARASRSSPGATPRTPRRRPRREGRRASERWSSCSRARAGVFAPRETGGAERRRRRRRRDEASAAAATIRVAVASSVASPAVAAPSERARSAEETHADTNACVSTTAMRNANLAVDDGDERTSPLVVRRGRIRVERRRALGGVSRRCRRARIVSTAGSASATHSRSASLAGCRAFATAASPRANTVVTGSCPLRSADGAGRGGSAARVPPREHRARSNRARVVRRERGAARLAQTHRRDASAARTAWSFDSRPAATAATATSNVAASEDGEDNARDNPEMIHVASSDARVERRASITPRDAPRVSRGGRRVGRAVVRRATANSAKIQPSATFPSASLAAATARATVASAPSTTTATNTSTPTTAATSRRPSARSSRSSGVVVVDSILAVRAVVRRGTGGGEHARRASRRGSRRARPALEKKRAVGCRSFRVSVFVRGRRADVRLGGGGHRGPRLERGRRGDTTRV